MLVSIIGFLWWLITLPIRLLMLPFKILSAIVSLVIYAVVLAIIVGLVVLFVL